MSFILTRNANIFPLDICDPDMRGAAMADSPNGGGEITPGE
jgi:hypothetical protein